MISDVLYLILYKILAYRKEVVRNNLLNSFPEKSEKEIIKIEEAFYSYFFDLVLETLKTLTITPKSVMKRIQAIDMSSFEKFAKENKVSSLSWDILATGNWPAPDSVRISCIS